MKVWNKEVNDCCLCPYLGNYSMDEEPYCKFSKKDIEDINVIPKHCPFAQPITKEVIEGFGFKTVTFCNIVRFELGIYRLYWFEDVPNFISLECICADYSGTDGYLTLIFRGTVNNPIELEFILHSIGVIE